MDDPEPAEPAEYAPGEKPPLAFVPVGSPFTPEQAADAEGSGRGSDDCSGSAAGSDRDGADGSSQDAYEGDESSASQGDSNGSGNGDGGDDEDADRASEPERDEDGEESEEEEKAADPPTEPEGEVESPQDSQVRTGCGWLGKTINAVVREENAKVSRLDKMLKDLEQDIDPLNVCAKDFCYGPDLEHYLCRSSTWPRYYDYCKGIFSNYGDSVYSAVASRPGYLRWALSAMQQDIHANLYQTLSYRLSV